MKFSEFKEINNKSKGLKATVDYTLMEINLVRLVIVVVDNEDGTVEDKVYIRMKDLIPRVLNGAIKLENPEKLYAYLWEPEPRGQIGYKRYAITD